MSRMARIHIDIRDDVDPVVALECVRRVVAMGRVSNGGTMYSYGTSFLTVDGLVWVYTRAYRKSDCFYVCKDKRNENEE